MHQRHVVKVAVPVLARQIGELKWDPGLLPAAGIRVRLVLIVLRDLQAEIAASCVDDEIEVLLVVTVDLDEMIAAAQRAQTLLRAACVDLLEAEKLLYVDAPVAAVGAFAHVAPMGDVFRDERIELGQVYALLLKPDNVHAAADIDAHEIGYDEIAHGHRSPDGAALARVNVRHDADLRARRERLIAERLNLPLRRGLEFVGVDYCCGVGAGDGDHFLFLFLFAFSILACSIQAGPSHSIGDKLFIVSLLFVRIAVRIEHCRS